MFCGVELGRLTGYIPMSYAVAFVLSVYVVPGLARKPFDRRGGQSDAHPSRDLSHRSAARSVVAAAGIAPPHVLSKEKYRSGADLHLVQGRPRNYRYGGCNRGYR